MKDTVLNGLDDLRYQLDEPAAYAASPISEAEPRLHALTLGKLNSRNNIFRDHDFPSRDYYTKSVDYWKNGIITLQIFVNLYPQCVIQGGVFLESLAKLGHL